MTEVRVPTPRWFLPMLQPARYKGIYGGRGSGKSHAIAEYILERCVMERTDVVCIREVQKSLQQSVKKLLEMKIEHLGVGSQFEIQHDRIKAKNGGIIIFQGMANHTADSIKSLEGYDIAWFEEAQSCSQRSLDLLRPTIRKPGSELLFTWNPSLPTDPVDALLRGEKPPPSAVTVQANYADNPWFPDVLRDEMEYDRARDPDKFAHIWLGEYQRNSEARVFRNWRVEEFDIGADWILRQGADWGFSVDPSVLVQCAIVGRTLYVPFEAYQVGVEIDFLPDFFRSVPDSERWTTVADSSRPETISYMQRHGFRRILPAIKGARSLEEGVEFLKAFDIVVHPRCKHLIDELTLYSYKQDPLTGQVLPVLQDKDNHCIAEGELVLCERGQVPIEQVTTDDRVWTRGGWQRVLFSGMTDRDREIVEVETTGGAVRCTPDHEIYTARGFVRADALRYNDEILYEGTSWSSALNGTDAYIADILKAGTNHCAGISNDRCVVASDTCTAMSGSTTTVRSLTGATSIILTAIRSITTPSIWNASRLRNILPSVTSGMTIDANGSAGIWMPYETHPKPGMQALQAERRTSGPGLWHTLRSLLLKSRAGIAPSRSYRARLAMPTSSAQTHARAPIADNQALTMKRGNAKHAALSSGRTNTLEPRLAQGRVVTVREAGRSQRVYDLTVENHHEFVCGGVLVSNCIDALRYACEGARRAKPQRPLTHRATTDYEVFA